MRTSTIGFPDPFTRCLRMVLGTLFPSVPLEAPFRLKLRLTHLPAACVGYWARYSRPVPLEAPVRLKLRLTHLPAACVGYWNANPDTGFFP